MSRARRSISARYGSIAIFAAIRRASSCVSGFARRAAGCTCASLLQPQPCQRAILCAFDLLEIDGEDLRRAPIEHREHRFARLLRSSQHWS